ncbi:glycosyltransferase family 4 protein [Bacterioplanoides sp. SCSIO 12839]|uniref:glycosyltransferase family 4 protein n=1 Tax=Bacterioplanoides sp. SCSIO 12839 TaxID=2829569 RepID=UPI002105CD78|nr:glycosyltransferase family 4 protein [Bacterioplanoides sp. SCSIO 12839]UTW46877.1 glycosyltransferase family 4 protein [Bacterioplanoides sp. SCSIO 12839]
MKISLLVDSRSMGGIETHIIQLARGLYRQQVDVELLLFKHYQHHPLVEELKPIIPVTHLEGSITKLVYHLKNTNTVLHTHGYKAGILGRLAGKLTNTPVVSTFHNGDPGKGKTRLYNALDRLTAGMSSNIAVSDSIAKQLLNNCQVVPNFIQLHDIEKQKVEKTSSTTLATEVAYVGRLSYEKGPDVFAQITQQLSTRQPSTHQLSQRSLNTPICMYGDGPMRNDLKHKYPHIHFYGQVDMKDYWQYIRVLVISSRHEGLPLVALEAMAHGIPVVASEAGDLPHLLQQANINSCHSINDYPAFIQSIQQYLQQSNAERNLQAQRMQRFTKQHYSVEACLPRIMSVYQHAIQSHRITAHS